MKHVILVEIEAEARTLELAKTAVRTIMEVHDEDPDLPYEDVWLKNPRIVAGFSLDPSLLPEVR